MALQAEFKALAVDVFDEFDDVVRAAVLKRPARPRRNELGAQVDASAQYSTRCVIASAERFDATTGLIRDYDATALIPANDVGVEPQAGDRLTVDGQTWTVGDGGVSADEAKAVWTLRLKRLAL